MAARLQQYFSFESVLVLNYYLDGINANPEADTTNYDCITTILNQNTNQLDIMPTDCNEKHLIICRKVPFAKPNCTPQVQKTNSFQLMLDPDYRLPIKLAVSRKRAVMRDVFNRMNKSVAFESLFATLWYASIPCFDIQNITTANNSGSSLLKYCEWKGIQVSCAAIFTTFPTDQGMCCSFNIKAADDIFIENTFTRNLQRMQKFDKNASLLPNKLPKWYIEGNEPTTVPSKNKGLVVMLDAHSDLLSVGSIDSDLQGFTAFIGPSGSFPLMSQRGIKVRPGYINSITLTSSKITADSNMKSLDPIKRNCLFNDEYQNLQVHKEYSYLNCKLECILTFTQNEIYKKYGQFCQPWYFPTNNDSITTCGPWEQFDFFDIMNNKIPNNLCSLCLPDCEKTTYLPSITQMPFQDCDITNIGVSNFCKFNNKKLLPMTDKLSNQILADLIALNNGSDNLPAYLHTLKSINRTHAKTVKNGDVFSKISTIFDPFQKDIAVLKIIFEKPTVLYIGSQSKMTWIDYLSTVGGLLGLVLGMGFISFVEIFWICLRIVSVWIDTRDWIP